ncbi:MAG: PilZ domain-containing protein [Gammaproteobacteria bacterium]
MSEKRIFQRIPFHAEATLTHLESRKIWPIQVLDLSLKGILTSNPDAANNFQADGNFSITIPLSDKGEEFIQTQAELAHQEPKALGFRISNIDVDSITHLRRLLNLNGIAEDALNRELRELLQS